MRSHDNELQAGPPERAVGGMIKVAFGTEKAHVRMSGGIEGQVHPLLFHDLPGRGNLAGVKMVLRSQRGLSVEDESPGARGSGCGPALPAPSCVTLGSSPSDMGTAKPAS